MKKYEVITYCFDSGYDEKLDYNKMSEARQAARGYIAQGYERAMIVNTETNKEVAVYYAR